MRHWIPPVVTEKMALSTARIHRVRGRPPLLAAGITSLIHSHSSSVRSLGYIFSFIYPFYTTHEDFSDRLLVPPPGGPPCSAPWEQPIIPRLHQAESLSLWYKGAVAWRIRPFSSRNGRV